MNAGKEPEGLDAVRWPEVWQEHVATALLGTRRRGVPELAEAELAEDDPAARLLDQAGLLAVGRRAGFKPGSAEAVAPAPAEDAPPVPEAARDMLGTLLEGERVRLLPEWLTAVAELGYRVPARYLPELLDRGRADRAIRPLIARAAGRRGAWLALRNTDWAYLLTESEAAAEPVADWAHGNRGQRVAALTGARRADPAEARDLLLRTWPRESAPDRAAFLATFAHGLSPDDEEFLESALDDRGKDVRRRAADLLSLLPGTAYARRMAERARSLVRLSGTPARRHLTVTLPAEHDDAMARDGIPFHPAGSFDPAAARTGVRAAWLREILARAPLDTWPAHLGLSAAQAVALPVADDFARDVHLGWCRAAQREGSAEWARALLREGFIIDEAESPTGLLALLPEDDRAVEAAALLSAAEDHAHRLRLLSHIPAPWAGPLTEAVLTALSDALTDPDAPRVVSQLCRLADERLAPDAAPRVHALAAAHPTWPLAELADTLAYRRHMLRDLTPP
ncbi:DUF5691 domain-containing protein [Actinocorallia sp. A-T 12471]|uniref:DUF5691 domain-containing protein n=1 Tax=Actinocorallia sp. A-T 12471 TaxID=3089813 RepID=UPI0029CBC63E|nr:DUF5691 domain-containing protein [Actinocorallia sp. A-T 12471]MDX6739407.1 DUF5691 domain-containing protein [Actinocorallia sp. A-T 12471]